MHLIFWSQLYLWLLLLSLVWLFQYGTSCSQCALCLKGWREWFCRFLESSRSVIKNVTLVTIEGEATSDAAITFTQMDGALLREQYPGWEIFRFGLHQMVPFKCSILAGECWFLRFVTITTFQPFRPYLRCSLATLSPGYPDTWTEIEVSQPPRPIETLSQCASVLKSSKYSLEIWVLGFVQVGQFCWWPRKLWSQ